MSSRQQGVVVLSDLNDQLASSGLRPLNVEVTARFEQYLALLVRWNVRINLTAIRDPKQIISRHFMESIACAQALPAGIATLLDVGTGAGFPGIPIALCRPEISVTLAESQNKKAAFLQEAVRSLGLRSRVYAGRAEDLEHEFDCVALRAVDRMEKVISEVVKLVRSGGLLVAFTTRADLPRLQGSWINFQQVQILPIAGSEQRVLVLASNSQTS